PTLRPHPRTRTRKRSPHTPAALLEEDKNGSGSGPKTTCPPHTKTPLGAGRSGPGSLPHLPFTRHSLRHCGKYSLSSHHCHSSKVAACAGMDYAVLLMQWEVARRRAGGGGSTVMAAPWCPWVTIHLGFPGPRSGFRPPPNV